MHRPTTLALLCTLPALLALAACSQAPTVPAGAAAPSVATVAYAASDKFTDVGDSPYASDRIRAAYLEDLRKYIERSAARYVPADQRLAIRVTDVDMAGNFEPWRSLANRVRIVRDVYPPRIDLQFRLTGADGALIKEGERQLRDSAFLTAVAPSRDGDPLRFEKALIANWMAAEFRP